MKLFLFVIPTAFLNPGYDWSLKDSCMMLIYYTMGEPARSGVSHFLLLHVICSGAGWRWQYVLNKPNICTGRWALVLPIDTRPMTPLAPDQLKSQFSSLSLFLVFPSAVVAWKWQYLWTTITTAVRDASGSKKVDNISRNYFLGKHYGLQSK